MLLAAITISCFPKQNPNIIIINKSNRAFTNVFVRPVGSKDSTDLGRVATGNRLKGFFKMTNDVTGDGCYVINAIAEYGANVQKCIGYYTNGASLDRGIQFTIMDDTTLIESW